MPCKVRGARRSGKGRSPLSPHSQIFQFPLKPLAEFLFLCYNNVTFGVTRMIRLGFSWKTAVVATFFVSLLGLNFSLGQTSSDIVPKKNSTNFQTIEYGTPKQTYTENTSSQSHDTDVTVSHPKIIVRHINPPKITPAPEPQPQQCAICPTSNEALKTTCVKCPPQQNPCGTCGGYREVSTADTANIKCPMIMCAQ